MERAALDEQVLVTSLGPRWARVAVIAETASTNADLLAAAAAPDRGVPDRTVLVAEHQLEGRGRFDRSWTSPPRAGLTFSVLVRPQAPIQQWGWLPLLAGVALHEAIATSTRVATVLKWPNDVLSERDGRKLAGILAQTSGTAQTPGEGAAVVLGVGLNVDTTQAELPVETATSLGLAGASGVDRTELLVAILTRLDARYAQWSDCRGDAGACGLAEAYRSACTTIGRSVRVALGPGASVEGQAEGVDDAGRLIVRTPEGVQSISAGDVEHVLPA